MRYTTEDACRAWLTYGLLKPDISAGLLKEYGSAEALYEDFVKTDGSCLRQYYISDASIQMLATQAPQEKMHDMLVTMRKLDAGILYIEDDAYPDLLRQIRMPPTLLFYRGNLACLKRRCVTVVGSRKASRRALEFTRKLTCNLSQAGLTVVSGLAVGIDCAAHQGCLDAWGPTVGLLACGMDVSYPREHDALREEIIRHGGILLSEYPLGLRPSPHSFHPRNRIMSGLSEAVLMTEARIRSGSMTTVQHALEQGREVFAYPGIPGTEWAEGAHQLLRDGARMFTSAKDVLEDLFWNSPATPIITEPPKKADSRPAAQSLPPMSEEQKILYDLLREGEMTFDELADACDLSVTEISSALTMLELAGVIRSSHGKTYSRI